MSETAKRHLRAHLTEYPNTKALRAGQIASDLVSFAHTDFKFVFDAFKPLVRDLAYDVSELAIVTFLQARQYDKDLVLLPFSMSARFQHGCLFHNVEQGPQTANALAGKRIGVRSYSQTTVAWVRGILQTDYGLTPESARWITFDDSHLLEYRDPPVCERAAEGKKLMQCLLDGEVDVAVLPPAMVKDPRLQPVIPDAGATARDWSKRTGILPMNHMVVVTGALSRNSPEIVREIFRILAASKAAAPAPADGIDMTPIGVEANRTSLEAIIDFSVSSGVIDRRFTVDELFDDLTRQLGA